MFSKLWKWKNKIKDVFLLLRIVNQQNSSHLTKKIKISEHNSISLKKIFKVDNYNGLVECQFFFKE